MVKEIRAKFSGGVIRPLEDIDLEEGQEVVVTISELPKGKGCATHYSLRRAAGKIWSKRKGSKQTSMLIVSSATGLNPGYEVSGRHGLDD